MGFRTSLKAAAHRLSILVFVLLEVAGLPRVKERRKPLKESAR
ncbi:MAG: hypothetical protein AB1640_07045 [bacterium]